MVKLDSVNEQILRTVGLYRVVTRPVVALQLAEGGSPDKRLGKMVTDKLLRAHKGLGGNRSVYQLTKKGAGLIGVSPARGRTIGSQSMLKNLGVLFFCHVEGESRHRVEAKEVSEALNVELPDGAYCVSRVKDQTVVFECYVPGPQTPIDTVIWHLRKRLSAVRKSSSLAGAVKDLRFGFALIVSNSHRRKSLMDAVRTTGPDGKPPLIKRARIWIVAVQELETFTGTASRSLGSTGTAAAQTLLWDKGQ